MAAQTFVVGVSQALRCNAFTRSGYTFLGWASYSTATSAELTNGEVITIVAAEASSQTLYAVWKKNVTETPAKPDVEVTETVKVYFNGNGGSGNMSSQTFVVGEAQNLKSCSYTRSGYTFLGWSWSSGATTATYTDGQTVVVTENAGSITLYAVWAKN